MAAEVHHRRALPKCAAPLNQDNPFYIVTSQAQSGHKQAHSSQRASQETTFQLPAAWIGYRARYACTS